MSLQSHRTIAGIAFALFSLGCGEQSGFDRARWDEGRGKLAERNPRADLVESAVSAGLRPGETREDIRALLGHPDIEGAHLDIYYLGRQRWAPELHDLQIEYDEAGIATDVRVVQ
jgi:hypothetical protein